MSRPAPSAAAASPEDLLESLSREELVQRLLVAEERVKRNQREQHRQARKAGSDSESGSSGGRRKHGKKRPAPEFDHSEYQYGFVALRVAYLGGNYGGMAAQFPGDDTIESRLFDALERCKLIKDRASCQYSCCGRTDKGVSALGQVVSLLLRTSNRPVHRKRPRSTQDGSESQTGKQQNACEQAVVGDSSFEQPSVSAGELDIDETGLRIPDIDYCRVLNNALPKDIAVLGWAPVPKGFSARHECSFRVYRYFFFADGMDLGAMNTAAKLIEGSHDFRHFCQVDLPAVCNFRRAVFSLHVQPCGLQVPVPAASAEGLEGPTILPCSPVLIDPEDPELLRAKEIAVRDYGMNEGSWTQLLVYVQRARLARSFIQQQLASGPGGGGLRSLGPNQLCEAVIVGNAFLLHQIRFTMSILFMVGRGQEDPDVIIPWLFDVEKNPQRPAYQMADALPLVLTDCAFGNIRWRSAQEPFFQESAFTRFFESYRRQRMHAHISDVFASAAMAPLVHHYSNPTAAPLGDVGSPSPSFATMHSCCAQQVKRGSSSAICEDSKMQDDSHDDENAHETHGGADGCACHCCLDSGAGLASACECVRSRVLHRIGVWQLGERSAGARSVYVSPSVAPAAVEAAGPGLAIARDESELPAGRPAAVRPKTQQQQRGATQYLNSSCSGSPSSGGGSGGNRNALVYKPLLKLPRMPSFEDAVARLGERQRIVLRQSLEASERNRERHQEHFRGLGEILRILAENRGFLPADLVRHE